MLRGSLNSSSELQKSHNNMRVQILKCREQSNQHELRWWDYFRSHDDHDAHKDTYDAELGAGSEDDSTSITFVYHPASPGPLWASVHAGWSA